MGCTWETVPPNIREHHEQPVCCINLDPLAYYAGVRGSALAPAFGWLAGWRGYVPAVRPVG